MAYKTKELYDKAINLAEKNKCFFVEQLISFLPCSKPTFYDHFKIDSNEFNNIKDILEKNRVDVKSALYNKWFKSDNPTLQIALYKTICTNDEREKLSQNYQKEEEKKKDTTITFNFGNDSIKLDDLKDES